MKTLLLVEDDKMLQEIITEFFSRRDYSVFVCEDEEETMDILQKDHIDLIFLDVMLPDTDGFTLCRRIRKIYSCPIIFLTARVSEKDKLTGYSQGADDYVTKPFSLKVLYAKAEALLNRVRGYADIYEKGPILINRSEKKVFVNHKDCLLAPKEYEILLFLMENEGRIYSREQLLLRFWGYDFEGNERVVDNHIRKLRKALGTNVHLIHPLLKHLYKKKQVPASYTCFLMIIDRLSYGNLRLYSLPSIF